jgi:hypothetical protein
MRCTECGSLGMQPACVRNSPASLGTCGCAAVLAATTLQKCAVPGQRVPLLQATGFCVATSDLSADLLSPTLTLDFGALAIAPCLLGLSDNGCVNVRLPLASGGGFPTPLTVILAPAPPSATYSSSRRRLLSNTIIVDYVNVSAYERFQAAVRLCIAQETTRAARKACLHWHELADAANTNGSHININININNTKQRVSLWLQSFDDHGGLVWPLAAAAWDWLWRPRPPLSSSQEHQSKRAPVDVVCTDAISKRPMRRLLQAEEEVVVEPVYASYSTLPTLMMGSSIPWTLTLTSASSACPVLDEAITTVSDAWVDTVAFYAQGGFVETMNAEEPTHLERALNETLANTNVERSTGLLPSIANAVLWGYGDRIVDAVVTRDETRLLSGRRLLKELSTCNYTELTFGTRASVNVARGMTLLYICMGTFGAVWLFTTCFIPGGCATYLIWASLFPMLVFWAAYGIAPTCWPMVPPRFAHDLSREVGALVPSSMEIPRFLVESQCDVRGNLLLDGSYDPACFKTCTAEPFLFKSWQDSAAWWACDLSPTLCAQASETAQRWGFLSDFVSSTAFFGEVVAFALQDPDYTAAFRTCAFFASAELLLSIALAFFLLLIFPSVLVTVFEIFGAALVMLSQASASEAATQDDDDNDDNAYD